MGEGASVLSDANAPLDGKGLNAEPVRDLTFLVLDSLCSTRSENQAQAILGRARGAHALQ